MMMLETTLKSFTLAIQVRKRFQTVFEQLFAVGVCSFEKPAIKYVLYSHSIIP